MFLATLVVARPRRHNETSPYTADVALIVKEHQDPNGHVWAVGCTGPMSLKMIQCGYDSQCTINGSILNENLFCSEHCECASGENAGAMKHHKLSSVMKIPQNHGILRSRSLIPETINYTAATSNISINTTTTPRPVGRLFRHRKPQMNFTQTIHTLANSTSANSTLPSSTLGGSLQMSCSANMTDACSSIASCCELGFVHSAEAECVSSCMCMSPGKTMTEPAPLQWRMRPSEFSPSCYGDLITTERCLEYTHCSSKTNGTLVLLGEFEECMSMCSCA